MISEDECIDILAELGWVGWQAKLGLDANFCCEYCDRDLLASVHDYDAWQRDHIVPLATGGVDEEWNWALACKFCNYLKGDRVFQDVDPRSDRAAAISAIRAALAPYWCQNSENLIKYANTSELMPGYLSGPCSRESNSSIIAVPTSCVLGDNLCSGL